MKLKEIPYSLHSSIALSRLPIQKLTRHRNENIPVIVSLTTIPSRLGHVHLTIRSLLNQTVSPKKIVLWINDDLRTSIPKRLDHLQSELFEIKFSHLTSSHRKLIHSLKEYPKDIIITCDDDLMYRKNWLGLLYKEHLKYPDFIIANQVRYITYDKNGSLLPYREWKYQPAKDISQKAVLPIGAEGILYPASSLAKMTTEPALFLRLAPKADDLWFKAMALLQGTNAKLAEERPPNAIPILGSQRYSLKKANISGDKNREQWSNICDYFHIDLKS